MCKILTRSHACGHQIKLGKESCFLVKNRFQYTDEEEKQVKNSKHDCYSCRRQQWKVQRAGTVSSPVKGQHQPHFTEGVIYKPHAENSRRLDPATIIANLKALCAEITIRTTKAVPKPETNRPNSVKPGISELQSPIQRHDHMRSAVLSPVRLGGDESTSDSEGSFADSVDGRDSYACRFNVSTKPLVPEVKRCQADDRLEDTDENWKRDASNPAVSFGRRAQTLRHSHSLLSLSSRISKHKKSTLSHKSRSTTGSKTHSGLAAACVDAEKPHPCKRSHASNVSTGSAHSAKRRISKMLAQEFEQTAHLGGIVLQSPKISPLHLDPNEEYDPAQSYLAFVKCSGYGQ
jgi:hypothetical protein